MHRRGLEGAKSDRVGKKEVLHLNKKSGSGGEDRRAEAWAESLFILYQCVGNQRRAGEEMIKED